jgi:hypothetical protein
VAPRPRANATRADTTPRIGKKADNFTQLS